MPGSIAERGNSVVPAEARTRLTKPLEYAGLLDSFQNSDLTPVIGREYHGLQVNDFLKASNSDALIRDLAVTSKGHTLQITQSATDGDSLPTRCCVLTRPGCNSHSDA